MNPLHLTEIHHLNQPMNLIVESLENNLYQAFIEVADEECLILDNDGKPLSAHSLGEMHEYLEGFRFKKAWLRQQSAYDEMIGQPIRAADNTLKVPLGWSSLEKSPQSH